METGITREKWKALQFRKERLADCLQELEGNLSGLQTVFLSLVRDNDGKYSEKRTQALIDSFLEAHRVCLRLREGEEQAPEQEDETIYRSFLYCAIRYVECPPSWDSDFCELPTVRGCYGDILRFARNLTPADKTALLFYERYRPQELEGFFASMDELYHKITAVSVTQSADDADYLAMRERYRQEIDRMEQEGPELEEGQQKLQEMMSAEQRQEMLRQIFEDTALAEGLEKTAEEDIRQQCMQKDWLADFQEQETFCSQYLLFRRSYFESPFRWRFAKDIEHMLDLVLLRQGDSNYLDNDIFFYALALLEKAAKMLDRQTADRR